MTTTKNNRGAEAAAALAELGNLLRTATPKGMGFALMLFDLGAGGNMHYVSSAKRDDMIAALLELITHLASDSKAATIAQLEAAIATIKAKQS